jgi:hypothetical protein
MRPYILFIVMLAGGVALTALIGVVMDQRVLDQEQRREQAYASD